MDEFDLIIRNGRLIDGTGNPWRNLDVGVAEGKIAKIGIIRGRCRREIDAGRKVLCPGFIDLHNHSDLSILAYPSAESYVMQGVTTAAVGQCGISMGPLNPLTADLFKSWISPLLVPGFDYEWDWGTLEEYYRKVQKEGSALNLAPFVGQGTIRLAVKGLDSTLASNAEMKEMKELLDDCLESGAFGLSTGLILPPGCYANTEELVELASVLTPYAAIYTTHLRNEGDRLMEALKEGIEIAERNAIPIQISHHKAIGRANWGRVNATLQVIEEARQRGVEITFDVYPYTAASQMVTLLLPPWVLEGGMDKMFLRLMEKDVRSRLRKELTVGSMQGEAWLKAAGWENVFVASCPPERKYEGMSLAQILKKMDPFEDPYEGLIDWIREIKANATLIIFAMDETDVRTFLAHPWSSVSSDMFSIAPSAGGKIHPRAYGSFPRFLGKYVRDEKSVPLEDAIRKITSLPASKLRLTNRGLLSEGYCADIVIFDPATINDKATYIDPHQYSEGITYVLVNGEIVVDNGALTHQRPGKILIRE
jgi:N-acyl-D-amino-acid deacylase